MAKVEGDVYLRWSRAPESSAFTLVSDFKFMVAAAGFVHRRGVSWLTSGDTSLTWRHEITAAIDEWRDMGVLPPAS